LPNIRRKVQKTPDAIGRFFNVMLLSETGCGSHNHPAPSVYIAIGEQPPEGSYRFQRKSVAPPWQHHVPDPGDKAAGHNHSEQTASSHGDTP
jgi:hypothetical protein